MKFINDENMKEDKIINNSFNNGENFPEITSPSAS